VQATELEVELLQVGRYAGDLAFALEGRLGHL